MLKVWETVLWVGGRVEEGRKFGEKSSRNKANGAKAWNEAMYQKNRLLGDGEVKRLTVQWG